ncbi:MAG: sulfotransferase, partial [Thiotrichaceae bacterium]|nr:sulfotransferase [Thiotrichaceae bacterium]
MSTANVSCYQDNYIPVIVGSGRSGTTWVQDVLAKSNNYRTAFEPLHLQAVPSMSLYACKYLSDNDDSESLKKYLNNVFLGQISNIWVNYRVRPDRLHLSGELLIKPRKLYEYFRRVRKLIRHYLRYREDENKPVLTKFIRANLMIKWMTKKLNVKVLFVVRHPAAVIESKIRLGGDDWDPGTSILRYTRQQRLYKNYLYKHEALFAKKYSEAGKHAIIWCIENQCISEMSGNEQIQICFYENLITHPEREWLNICDFFGFKNTPGQSLCTQASQQARPERVKTGYSADQLSSWVSKLTEHELKEIQEVLDNFGIHC